MNVKIAVAVSALATLLCSGGAVRVQDAPQPAEKPDANTKPPTSNTAPTRVRLGGNVRGPKRIHFVAPVYPEEALRKNDAGKILVRVIIAQEGNVKDAQFISGPPLLAKPLTDAVRQWRYKPTLLDGKPVEVEITITLGYPYLGTGSK